MYKEIINKFNDWVSKQDKPISVKEGQIKLIEISKKEVIDDIEKNMPLPFNIAIDHQYVKFKREWRDLKERHLSTFSKKEKAT